MALSLITPPKGRAGGGSCFPSIVSVALGEPGVPVICWAPAGAPARKTNRAERDRAENVSVVVFIALCTPING